MFIPRSPRSPASHSVHLTTGHAACRTPRTTVRLAVSRSQPLRACVLAGQCALSLVGGVLKNSIPVRPQFFSNFVAFPKVGARKMQKNQSALALGRVPKLTAMSTGDDLMEAIESGDEAGVKRCLDDGADCMFADDEGFTVLHMACQEGYDAIVTLLLRKGSKIDQTDDDGVTPLMLSCEAGHLDVVALLISEKADVNAVDNHGKTAVFRAAVVAGSELCVKLLLDAHADVFQSPVPGKTLVDLCQKKSNECAQRISLALSKQGAGERLLLATEKGNVGAVFAMVTGGADVTAADADGWNALHFAAGEGTLELVAFFLRKGLKANTPAKDGATPIELATEEEHDDVVEMLREGVVEDDDDE